ncbi:MAG: chorismate-binding protein [Gammaproteobacteria bacterium]|nr:chorismate-binding protein [Gammaproteobacteria bacterium]
MSFQTRLLSGYTDTTGSTESGKLKLAAFNQFNPQRYPYLLSSSAVRESNTQYDILIAFPQYQLTLGADKTLRCDDEQQPLGESFFDTLEQHYQNNKTDFLSEAVDLPYTGGWFVYLAYEMANQIEPCLVLPALDASQPLAVAVRCPAAIIVDKQKQQCFAVAESAYVHLLDQIEQDYLAIKNSADNRLSAVDKIELSSITEADESLYLQQVEKIKQYIIDGDIFQANLSRQWQAILKDDVSDVVLFNALAKHNPSSFAALACLQTMSIISSSPERLVSLRYAPPCSLTASQHDYGHPSDDIKAIVETRPIAGTRRRDENKYSDEEMAKELLSHPKERAEHIMLIDLERNDLGRVCRPGSIHVNELMVLESWQHVHHIVSNISGELVTGKSPIDVIRAVFPGGTITGCPKVRCMQILAELEQQARGAYTGSLGYINTDGSMDFNILIRTMVREKNATSRNKITFRAGGGIVSDSIAENELAETRAKAKGLLKIFHLNNENNTI